FERAVVERDRSDLPGRGDPRDRDPDHRGPARAHPPTAERDLEPDRRLDAERPPDVAGPDPNPKAGRDGPALDANGALDADPRPGLHLNPRPHATPAVDRERRLAQAAAERQVELEAGRGPDPERDRADPALEAAAEPRGPAGRNGRDRAAALDP